MSPQDYAQQKAAASGSSFYYAFLFLPAERRAAITAFYAFCREVDDVVDEVADPGVAQTKLHWWRQEVAQAFGGLQVLLGVGGRTEVLSRGPISKSNALRMSTHPPGHVVMAAWRQSRRKQGGFME